MLLQLQRYDLVIRYKPGKEMLLADAMSRCPSHSSEEIKLDMRVDYIAFNKAWIAKLKEATWEDPILSTVYQLTQQGWPHQRRHTPRMARAYWDFRDELSLDNGLLLKGPRIVIPGCLHEEYLQRLHQGHLSATKVQQNARQHLYWPRLDADIIDYTRRCQECIKRSLPPKEPLQAHDVPEQPWECIAMDYFYASGKLYILICDYFSKFPFLFQMKSTSWANLKHHLTELFAIEGTPDEIMSDNGPPFNGKEFSDFLSGLGIRHSTSSPNYPQSNGFIERQIQTVKRLMEKATATGRSFQEALTGLRAQPLGDGLPSPAEILHGRSLTTRKATPVDIKAVRDSLIALQAKYIKGHDKAHQARAQRQLVTGEEVYYLSSNNNWLLGIITGTRDTGRSYDVLAGDGTLLRRNRSHLKPRSFDIPVIRANMNARMATPSQSEITNISLSVPEHPPKVKYTSHNNTPIHENIVDSSLSGPEHPPKVKYTEKLVPKLVIKCIGDTAYDSYIAETLMPLKSAFKTKKQTRFAGQPVTSVKTIPARRTRPHPPKWTQDVADPDLLIPIELSQPRTEQVQDLGGNLSAVSPSESHQSEETLPNVPLGQFQAQEGNSTSEQSIAPSDTETPSQSEIFSQSANIQNIQYNNHSCDTSTPSQKEIFSETGTGSSSEEDTSRRDTDDPGDPPTPTRSHSDQQESHSDVSSETPSQSEITQYTKNIVDSSNSYSTSTTSQSEIYSSNAEYEAGSESSSRETSRPSSPEAGSHQDRSLHSPLPEMTIVTRSFHDAVHAVRDQHQRAVTRRLLQQQVQLASQKALVNQQIKTSTPDPPKCNAMFPPRRSRARSGKANGVTSSSSEESSQSDSNEPRTASQARFQALKRRFETPPKTEEIGPSHGVAVKRQRLFRTPSSQSATNCPPVSTAQRTLPRSYSGTSSEGD